MGNPAPELVQKGLFVKPPLQWRGCPEGRNRNEASTFRMKMPEYNRCFCFADCQAELFNGSLLYVFN